ncbi:hypothetical protein JM83_3226 [Gillisia sp. Hel_I_86]|uniref:hypothetical protein n=1 Tax=Gillisia sp. Hel_I_86 TaxID=1249981 RepID=UPI0011991B23|nr:hypothetical protein [Gillisia sp. Hel_I_86]TVZ26585.1 hypothetical protein JM83_1561 [Gillisia sp. Hel_I_86]TVZ27908.1 hypothetical protein JM83_2986 [Gillisia sp. Hel_I_86]TVZ28122.1 hypothetical protein JM83_3226 [Gillisia sp. Hel_I_86]
MNLESGNYIELYNPLKYNFFPVRILESDSNRIKVKILSTEKDRYFDNYYLDQFGFRIPFISEKLINYCGFNRIDKSPIFNNKDYDLSIIECYQGKIDRNQFLRTLDIETRFLGFKILEKNKEEEFIEILKKLPFNCDFKSFQKENKLINSGNANILFKKLNEFGINDINTDKIILESKSE